MRPPTPDMDRDFAAGDPTRAKRARHGLQPGQIDALLASQGGRCRICRTNNPGPRAWNIDHDHRHCPGTYGCAYCIRGLLCTPCNLMLANADDDPATLSEGAAYLERADRDRRW